MNDVSTQPGRARDGHGSRRAVLRSAGSALVLCVVVAACTGDVATPSATGSASAVPTPTERPTESATPSPAATPTATPEPELSLDLPPDADDRAVTLTVTPAVPTDAGGQITVVVTNDSDERVDELVLRWPTELAETLFLAPFVPDPQLVTERGGNLVRPWTKWVIGPGEHGEPDGTTSLGYGPIEPGETFEIPLYVSRIAPGPVAFDLQVLAREAVLTLGDGSPAEVRVDVP